MSRMIPSYLSPDVISRGEREIFEILNSSPGTEDWTVLHSLNIPRHLKRPHHEIDFVIMAPGYGIFCLEVKSGDISRQEGIWITKDRFGKIHKCPISPITQAEEEMHTLRQRIKEKFSPNSRQSNILYSYGVMFPHVKFNPQDAETERWRIYDIDSVEKPINHFIEELSKNSLRQLSSYSWFNAKNAIPDKADIANLLNFLRPDFEFLITTPMRLGQAEERISSFTEEQYFILDGVEPNDKIVFQGAAGTGKTVLAIESAKRSLYKPQRTLVVCFNKLLSSWIKLCLEGFLYEEMGCVDAFCDFMENIAGNPEALKKEALQKRQKENGDDNYLETYYTEILPQAVLEKIRKGYIEKFDKIIIDEGQDIIRESYLDVLDGLLNGGMAGGKWEFYCDFERQNIFLEDVDSGKYLKLLEKYGMARPFQYRLMRNCRNTKLIAEEISGIFKTGSREVLSTNLEGIPVVYREYDGQDGQCMALQGVLGDIRGMGIADENITILSPRRLIHSCVGSLEGERIIDFSDDHDLFLTRDGLTFGTIYKFKGMENSFIVVADISGSLEKKNFEDLLYVGMSRARFGLVVLVDSKVVERLDALKGHLK